MMNYKKKKKAYVSLVAIIIITFSGIAIVGTLIWLSVSATKTNVSNRESLQARSLADLCAEKALNELKKDNNYAGSETDVYTYGECEILAVQASGLERTVQVEGRASTVVRRVEIEITSITPVITVGSWQEVADF